MWISVGVGGHTCWGPLFRGALHRPRLHVATAREINAHLNFNARPGVEHNPAARATGPLRSNPTSTCADARTLHAAHPTLVFPLLGCPRTTMHQSPEQHGGLHERAGLDVSDVEAVRSSLLAVFDGWAAPSSTSCATAVLSSTAPCTPFPRPTPGPTSPGWRYRATPPT